MPCAREDQANKEKDVLQDRQMEREGEEEEEMCTSSRGRKTLLVARTESHFVFLLFFLLSYFPRDGRVYSSWLFLLSVQ